MPRNHLNHLFGGHQLLQIVAMGDYLGPMEAALEKCLEWLSDDEATEGNVEVKPAGDIEPSRILIADDDEENRNILARLLEPCGHVLVFAKNGKEAVDAIENSLFDAVLLDIQMPEMDGFEVLASLRESGHLRHTPVIVVTGLQGEQDAVKCIEIGAEDFLSRPIRPALLMARLNASLEKKKLREQVFEQHFTPELARELARNPDLMKMQARHAEVSVLFCDIRNFSTSSERLGPAQTVDWLSGVMGEFSSCVIDNGGVLVDYTGDEIMAMWGAPNEQENHADLACQAALAILESLPGINEKWQPIVGAETRAGIGINTGEALVGNVGTSRKFKYGPLGTTVNVASRVQGATKYLKTPLLITGRTHANLRSPLCTRRLCQVQVQNITEPVELFELDSSNKREAKEATIQRYESALTDFENEKFRQASATLGDILVHQPNDAPSLLLMSRVVEAMLADGHNFEPVWKLPGK
ncbi:MAG: response regulator [Verrucomicrobiota bacterium]